MIEYPLDFTAKNDAIHITVKSENGKSTRIQPFDNYFYVIPDVTIEDARVKKSELVTKVYYGQEVQAKKIFCSYADTRALSDDIAKRPDVQYVLEADIPVVRKFLADTGIESLRGYDFSHPMQTAKESGLALTSNDLNIVGFDIETYGRTKHIDSKRNPILMIALVQKIGDKITKHVLTWAKIQTKHDYVTFYDDEKSMLTGFDDFLTNLNPDMICGYNSDAFDFAYVLDRAQVLDVKLKNEIKMYGGTIKNAVIAGMPHVDIFNFIRTNLRTQLQTTSYSLDAVSEEILGENKADVDVSKLYLAWDTMDATALDEYIHYNAHDSLLCVKLIDKLFPNILEFVRMIKLPIVDVTRLSYSQLVESYLITRSRAFNILVPNRPTRAEVDERLRTPPNVGAFVFKPTPGLYKNVVVCDFRSLYPSIIASLNIERSSMNKDTKHRVPEYDGELYFAQEPKAFLPTVIEDIILRRVEIKKQLKKTEDQYEKLLLDARSYNLKILANSMYGYLSFAQARWYCAECGGATTAYARYFIKYTIKKANDAGLKVLYSDTDSIFIELGSKTVDDAKAFVAAHNKTLPGIIELQFEDSFVSGIFVGAKGGGGGAKKRYALLSHAGKFKITGFEYVRNDWSDFARKTQKELLNILLAESNPSKALQFVHDQVKKLRDRNVTIPELIVRAKLSRDVNEYETNLPHVIIARQMIANGDVVGRGKNIEYVVSTGKGPIYERVKIPSEITIEEFDIDYYIHNQLLPVVESIMEVFNYKKTDLLPDANQKGLNAFFG